MRTGNHVGKICEFAVRWKKKLCKSFNDSEQQQLTGTEKRELIHHQFNRLFNKMKE